MYLQNQGTSLWSFFLNSGLREKFCNSQLTMASIILTVHILWKAVWPVAELQWLTTPGHANKMTLLNSLHPDVVDLFRHFGLLYNVVDFLRTICLFVIHLFYHKLYNRSTTNPHLIELTKSDAERAYEILICPNWQDRHVQKSWEVGRKNIGEAAS